MSGLFLGAYINQNEILRITKIFKENESILREVRVLKRIISGIISIFPTVYIILSTVILFYILINVEPDAIIRVEYRIYVVIGLLLLVVSVITEFVLMIVYIIHSVAANNRLTTPYKIVWALCLWFFNVFAVPVYWYKYILKQ